MLRSVRRVGEKTLSRYDFQKAMTAECGSLSLADIDLVFNLMSESKSRVTMTEWIDHVRTISSNALSEIRKIIKDKKLTEEQVRI